MYLVTDNTVLVYIDPDAAQTAGFDMSSDDDLAKLQQYLVALDTAAGKGNALIPGDAVWRFTTEKETVIDGVSYQFLQQIDGSYYNCIIGTDGADVTDSAHVHHVQPLFACFSALVPASEAVIVGEAPWTEKLGAFLQAVGKIEASFDIDMDSLAVGDPLNAPVLQPQAPGVIFTVEQLEIMLAQAKRLEGSRGNCGTPAS